MKFDIATVIGLIFGFALVTYGIAPDGNMANLMTFFDYPSALITFGGSISSIFVRFTLADIRGAFPVLRFVFLQKTYSPKKMIKDIYRYAEIARRDGILALENVTGEIEDPFLVKGIQLAVDGTDPELIKSLMERDLDFMQSRHDGGKGVIEYFSTQAPAFGMIGTLIGLVLMLKNLNDPKQIGPNMAIAIITTFYGALVAYLTFGPFSGKLDDRTNEERLIKEMIIQGVMSIQSGDNPRIVEQKLKVFLAPSDRV